jgi:hypothetical protein
VKPLERRGVRRLNHDPRICAGGAVAVSAQRSRRANQRRATREAILQNVAPYRNEDGSYTVAAATWGVLVR